MLYLKSRSSISFLLRLHMAVRVLRYHYKMNTLQNIDQRRTAIASRTPQAKKSELGQFMTPTAIGRFMASLFSPLGKQQIHLLDAGAGIGSLTAVFAARALHDRAKSVDVETWEIDPALHGPLTETLEGCREAFREENIPFRFELQTEDFIESAPWPRFTHAILNPPYKKIRSESAHRQMLRQSGIETSNLYSAFVALSLLSLKTNGELVAITPRSFCNGTYFKLFRRLILEHSAMVRVHVFESRDHAFKGDEVLQENVIFHLVHGKPQGDVIISSCRDASFADLSERTVPFSDVVMPGDPEQIINLIPSGEDPVIEAGIRTYTHTLKELGLDVATGPVVDFRLRAHLRQDLGKGYVPLIYPFHFNQGFIAHPKADAKKPNAIADNDETTKWLMPSGHYVVVRRLTSKEEKRRIVPCLFDPKKIAGERIGFENHLNVFHAGKHGLPAKAAKGLALYLGSTFADQWFRRFNGHTQVNAGDLRAMRYPSLETLTAWGSQIKSTWPTQEEIDAIVEREIDVEDRRSRSHH